MNDAQARFLQVAGRNCVRLSELINDLLDLSKIEAGRLDVHRAQLDLNQVLSDMTETFSVSARDRRLRLNLDATGELTAFADDRLVRRILSNLLSNAVKFTSKGSITVRAEQRRGTVTVTVADTGIGIPAAEVPRMFEKFHQACAQDGTRPPGTGLGLALTKQMVEMNGGKIWFESKEGIGTKFHFTLPCSSDAGDRTNA
jgi:signal transduction histidine kinase